MKKLIGALGIAVIAVAMFFSANTNNIDDTNLASLLAINTANAEVNVTINDCDRAEPYDECSYNGNWPGCDNSIFWDTCEETCTWC